MRDKNSKWMLISGITGATFFILANFTRLFTGSSEIAACIQLCINAFVFVVWSRAFTQSKGFKKFVAFFGVVVPVIMASITLWRVLCPVVFR